MCIIFGFSCILEYQSLCVHVQCTCMCVCAHRVCYICVCVCVCVNACDVHVCVVYPYNTCVHVHVHTGLRTPPPYPCPGRWTGFCSAGTAPSVCLRTSSWPRGPGGRGPTSSTLGLGLLAGWPGKKKNEKEKEKVLRKLGIIYKYMYVHVRAFMKIIDLKPFSNRKATPWHITMLVFGHLENR